MILLKIVSPNFSLSHLDDNLKVLASIQDHYEVFPNPILIFFLSNGVSNFILPHSSSDWGLNVDDCS